MYTGTRPGVSPAIRAGKGWRGRRELAPRCSATQLGARPCVHIDRDMCAILGPYQHHHHHPHHHLPHHHLRSHFGSSRDRLLGFRLGSFVSVGSVLGGTSSKGSRQVSVGIRSLSCALLALDSVVWLWRRRYRTCQKGQASSILRRRRMNRRMAFAFRYCWCRAWGRSCLCCQGLWLCSRRLMWCRRCVVRS